MTSTHYTGRFAPSPTGHLHFGSLLAAMASYADARQHQGQWKLRIDDIDPPRAMPDANRHIQQTLSLYGFNWDGDAILQSNRSDAYQHALATLNSHKYLYLCQCSRRDLSGHNVYPGTCKPVSTLSQTKAKHSEEVLHKLTTSENQNAIRVIMETDIVFSDTIQGAQQFRAGEHFGDTVVLRRDELFSYALCCAVDDANNISHVVRGQDLLSTTAAQLHIMRLLNLSPPQYAHIPIAINEQAQKLSKQTLAKPISEMPVLATLNKAWDFLGQQPLAASSVKAFWENAIAQWNIEAVPKVSAIQWQQ